MSTRLVLVTFPDNGVAAAVARGLLEARLVACVNILPGVKSLYLWQDQIQEENECVAVLKTTKALVAALEARLKELHPYKVPEFVVIDPVHVSVPYERWLLGELARSSDELHN